MARVAGLMLGFVNPHAQYAYRVLKHTVAQASLSAAVLEGTFIEAEGLTFFAEGAAIGPDGLELDRVFVYEQRQDGRNDRGHRAQWPARARRQGRPSRSGVGEGAEIATAGGMVLQRPELADRHRDRSLPRARSDQKER